MVLLINSGDGEKILPLDKGKKIYVMNLDPEEVSYFTDVVDDIHFADAVLMRLNAPCEPRKGFLESIFHQGSLELIFEEVAPTGKLPFEIPSSTKAVEEQLEDVPFDSKNPLFPFGHGLSYEQDQIEQEQLICGTIFW